MRHKLAQLPGRAMCPEALLAMLLERAKGENEFRSVMVSVEYQDETFEAFYSAQKPGVTLCHAAVCRALADCAFFHHDEAGIVTLKDDGA